MQYFVFEKKTTSLHYTTLLILQQNLGTRHKKKKKRKHFLLWNWIKSKSKRVKKIFLFSKFDFRTFEDDTRIYYVLHGYKYI